MEVIPAIDLRHGEVVRLNQGDFRKQTTFSKDPVRVARHFEEVGVPRIHLVDLDGALEGSPVQRDLCRAVAEAVRIPIQVGGGFGTEEHVAMALEAGLDRVVLGTAAVENPELVAALVDRHGAGRIVVGLDARDGFVAVSGWTRTTGVQAVELMASMHAVGVRRFMFTDIDRDGTLGSPNFDATGGIVYHGSRLSDDVRVIASGGIGGIDHLRRLARLGVEGAIVGSAIYRGALDLRAAIAELGAGPSL